MPAGFVWPLEAQFWVPSEYDESYTSTNRGAWFLGAVGRLKPGVRVEQAKTEFGGLAHQLETEYPKFNAKVGMTVRPLLDALVGDSRKALLVILGAVGFVLLIACVNVANLVLSRASAREDELAIRVALGAGRGRLIRQLVVESLLLASVGGVTGLALAVGGTRTLVALRPAGIPRLDAISVDGAVLAFTVAATLVTGLLFGLVPAWQLVRRGSVADRLHERGRSGLASKRSQRLRSVLVVAETALAVVLLSGAVLLIRSFAQLSRVDPGFVVGHAITFGVGLPDVKYDTDEKRSAFYRDLIARLRALPGVTDVGAVLAVPPTPPTFNLSFGVTGRPDPPAGEEPTLEVRVADADYFHTMGIALRRGRLFSSEDRPGSTPGRPAHGERGQEVLSGRGPDRQAHRARMAQKQDASWRRRDRRRRGREVVRTRPNLAAADLRGAISSASRHDRLRRPFDDGRSDTDRAGARGRGGKRSGHAAQPRGDAGRARAQVDRDAAFLHAAARGVRVGRARACRGRHLRRALVSGHAAHARDRHPCRARRGPPIRRQT